MRRGVVTGMETFDLAPAARATAAVVSGVCDDQLAHPTPCPEYTVADLLAHVGGLSLAFTHAARKTPVPGGAAAPGSHAGLEPGWRDRTVDALETLAQAWTDPAAWEGSTMAGPVEMDAPGAALVALDEVVVHGWDLAVATGQPYEPPAPAVEACAAWVASFDVPADDDGGLFGPPVPVAADAAPLARLVALTGRDPGWAPPAG